jgi:hypothetical protein
MTLSPKHPTISGLFVRWLPMLAIALVIVHYFWFVNSYAINVPFQDDIYDFLQVVNLADAADGASGVSAELFRQYVDHRTTVSRVWVYAAYLAEGEVNFRTLTILANLMLPLILLLFYLSVRGEKYRWIWLLVCTLLLLHLRAESIVLWSQPAFAYYSVFLFAFAGLFALHKVTLPKFVLAAILCTFSAFSYASGQIVWLLGLASLLHQCFISGRRSLLYPAIWLLIAVAVLVLWRTGFMAVNSELGALSLPSQLTGAPLPQVLARYAGFFLAILGSAFTDTSAWGAGVAGLLVMATLVYISLRFIRHEDIRLALCCWFVVASAAAVTLGRAWWLPPDYVLITRYSFLSVILVCTLALLVQTRFKVFQTPAVYLVVMLAAGYWAWAHVHFETTLQENLKGRYREFNNARFTVFGKPEAESTAIVTHAISAGIYQPPCRPLPECETAVLSSE